MVVIRRAPEADRVVGPAVAGADARSKPVVSRLVLSVLATLAVVVLLVTAQLVLPRIAANRLTDSLERNGTDVHVSVAAFPAEELLFGEADSVAVRVERMASASHHVGDLLARTAQVGTLTASVGQLVTHGLVLDDVRLVKRGRSLLATATVARAAIQAILPPELSLTVAPGGTNGLVVQGRAQLFSHAITVRAEVQARSGDIVLYPLIGGLGSMLSPLHVTLFANRSVAFDSVTAVSRGNSYTLTARGLYR
jgi:hypothetical protein